MEFLYDLWSGNLANSFSMVICTAVRIYSPRSQRISLGGNHRYRISKKQRFYNVQMRKRLLAGCLGFHVVSMLTTWNPRQPARRGTLGPDFNGSGTCAKDSESLGNQPRCGSLSLPPPRTESLPSPDPAPAGLSDRAPAMGACSASRKPGRTRLPSPI